MTTPAVIRRRDIAAIRRRAVRTGQAYARQVRRQGASRPADRPFRLGLWLPSTALFMLLAPFPILLAPLGYLIPSPWRVDPFRAVFALGAVLLSLGGTQIVVKAQGADIAIKLF